MTRPTDMWKGSHNSDGKTKEPVVYAIFVVVRTAVIKVQCGAVKERNKTFDVFECDPNVPFRR